MSEDVFPPANLSALSTPWAREHDKRVSQAERSLKVLRQEVSGQNRNTASSLASLGETILSLQATIASMPITQSQGARQTGFGLTSSWTDIVSVTMPFAPGKNTVSIFCVANGGALDTVSGGLTTSYGRIVIQGQTVGPAFPASKDAGVSQVLNVISASHSETTGKWADTITATFQMYGLNGSAFPATPGNFAQLSLLCSFL